MQTVSRLIDQFVPAHYDLSLTLNRRERTFHGTITIDGSVLNDEGTIRLHSKELSIDSIAVDGKASTFSLADNDELVVSREDITSGQHTIVIGFRGMITDGMHGLYPCYYDHEGIKKELLATQFESHHAREVFPCIDEPEAKATFQLTLTHPDEKAVLSNTPIAKQISHKKGWQTTTFEITPHMSTYLLAFVFGDMEYKESKTTAGTVVRTYATPENVDFTDFALEVCVKTLEFFEDYFDIAYPLQKCDLIALPDFASGAMENWGCITFREQALLVDPKNSTLSTKQYVALVVAHELAHQWFGNLVTMRWWTDLWLNEGFASWIEYLATDKLFPEWDVWTQFIVDEQQQSLKLDALEHTHAIEVPVRHPDEIRTIFDAISYGKGASVINMLHQYLGPEDFKQGLRQYLQTHKYSNTDTVDLWKSLEEASDKPVRKFMHEWTATPGFPLLTATIHEDSLELKQQRFFSNPKHKKLPDQTWPIPLLAKTKGLPATLDNSRHVVAANSFSDLKLNQGQNGFYRTTYNATHLQRLGELIDKGRLTSADRLGVLNDMFEASKAGLTDTVDALHFLKHFKDESQYPVWDSIATVLGGLRLVMDDEGLRDEMKPYVRKLVAKQLERLGWDAPSKEPHFDKLLRPIILGLAASADEPEIVKHCLKLFDRITATEDISPQLRVSSSRSRVKRGIDIDPDLRGTVFGTVARLGGAEEFEKLVHLHHTATLTEEKTTLAAAITGFKQPALIKKSLELIKSNEVRLQDVSYWIAYSLLNRYAREETWRWVKDNWGWIQKNLGTDLSFYRMPIYVARVFSKASFKKDYQEFFVPKMSPALERSYNQGLEMIEWQSEWKRRALKEVKLFFKSQ